MKKYNYTLLNYSNMKAKCLILMVLFVTTKINSQTIAGSVSSGNYISNPTVNLSNSDIYTTVFGLIDLDCDSVADIKIALTKGPTSIDGPNSALLYVLNPDIKICADSGFAYAMHPVNYFNTGDTIVCDSSNIWSNDSILYLGLYGTLDAQGPFTINNLFFGYINTNTLDTGWVKLSFDLIDNGNSSFPITLVVNEVLSPCQITSVLSDTVGMAECSANLYQYQVQSPYCAGECNGSISFNMFNPAINGCTFLWDNASTGSSINNVCASNRYVIITNTNDSSCIAHIDVNEPTALNVTAQVTPASFSGGADGSITISVTGGTAAYTFLWSPNVGMGATVINLLAGNYSCCVMDGQGCEICSTYVVNEEPAINVTEQYSSKKRVLEIMPNPSNGSFIVKHLNQDLKDYKFQIIDLTGKSVFEGEFDNKKDPTINSSFENGVYFLVLSKVNQSERIITKLVIQN